MRRIVQQSHFLEGIVRYCIFFLFAAMVSLIGIPEGLSAPQKAPTVKDLIEEEPKGGTKPPPPAARHTPAEIPA